MGYEGKSEADQPARGSVLAPDWLSVPEDLDALSPEQWAQDVSRDPDSGELAVAGIGVRQLAEEFGTPLFVVSESDFRQRARAFKKAFDEAFQQLCGGADVYYAGKSFLCISAARWVREEGLRLDTCSGGEMLVAQRAGFPGAELGLHGNNKSDAELLRALELGVGRIIVDSLPELDRIDALAGQLGVTAPVMLRLTPGVHAHTHEFIATAHEDQKFGLSLVAGPLSETSPAEQAVVAAQQAEHIRLLGLHCHIGSQIFEPASFQVAAERLMSFAAQMRDRHGMILAELDLGGGYGIAYTEADSPRSPEEIAGAMAEVVAAECARWQLTPPRISIEPGRAIAGPSTFTLYRVGTIKDVAVEPEAHPAAPVPSAASSSALRRYVSVDGGMSDNPRPVLYEADYTAVLGRPAATGRAEPGQPVPVLSRVAGKHCESGDIVVRDVYLPGNIEAGDLLAVPGTGAYCWSLASNYNYQPRPAVIAVREGEARTIIRGETEADLLTRDVES